MSKVFTVAKGEFRRYFISPLAYVYLICFLVLNASFALYFGGIFTSGNASLKPMFDFLPWLYLLFIPGIAMRLWAEEFKSNTILQIITLPVSVNAYVWGKFLAAWAFCTLALLLTFPFVVTLNILGSPDNWVIFNSYLGAFLLAGAMLAISQTASALTKNQVIALVIAVVLNLLFFLSGLEYVLGFFRGIAPDYIISMISSFSFLTHAANFNFGIFELRGLIFFVSLIVMFNFFTSVIVSFKTAGTASWFKTTSVAGCLLASLLVFGAFFGLNLFADNILRQFRVDFTAEQLFTPSVSTQNILRELPSPVTAKVYYSPLLGERDEEMRLAFDNLKLLLQTYRQLSKGKFTYHIYNPEPLSDIEDRALHAGLQALPVSDINAAAYFGIVLVNENGQSRTIPFLPLARQNLLEQDLTENIYLLEHPRKTLGLLTSLPILGASSGNVISQPWQIAEELQKYYDIKVIRSPADLQNIDLLMIAHPQKMPADLEQAIYNYSIHNGKILAFFDVAPEALQLAGPQTSLARPSDYGSLPAKWGFHFYNNKVVADLYNSSQVTIETPDYSGTTQDLIQFYLTPDNFFADLPETSSLKRMLLTSASVFMPLKDSLIYFVPLMQASPQSQLLPAEVVTRSIHPAEILRRFQADNQPKYIAAHIIGQEPDKAFELIAVGDSDMLYDSFWTSSTQIGDRSYNIPLLDNGNFVLNALDVLSGSNAMLSLRGKSPQPRPFASLEQQQKQILRQFKIKEKDIFDQIDFIKRGLQEIWSKKDFEGRQNFTPEELSIISKIKNNLETKRRELYAVRTELNYNLQETEFWVKLFNIYTIPGLIILAVLIRSLRRFKICVPVRPRFNRHFLWLLSGTIFCLGLGFGSLLPTQKTNQVSFEGSLLFPELTDEINNVAQIRLQTHDKELLFIKQNNFWILAQQPEFMVNQNRIKSFLTALMQATLYEKKADKLENLPRFGLLPLDNPDSRTTAVTLSNAAGTPILSFETGKYNIELGRGSLGAYIRLPGQFRIWLAAIELIDLDMNYHNWTYASLWNLQFGRFSAINGSSNPDNIAAIAKILLNTPLSPAETEINTAPLITLKLSGEYFEQLTLAFYEQEQKFYVQYKFNGLIKSSVLQKFADRMQERFYQLSAADMEKIKNAVNSRSSQ